MAYLITIYLQILHQHTHTQHMHTAIEVMLHTFLTPEGNT